MSNTTKVVGYYNGNRWPIQLVISRLNITLTLEPGKYLLDRAGRKINDPYFEVYANNKQLHRELSEKEVPIIVIPEVTAPVTATASGNPVRAITSFTRDEQGRRQPVLTQPQPAVSSAQSALPAAVVASATESVKPMSMEEARKRGFVRKVREVPEDYGVNDTTGLPPSGIPKMRYSTDPGMNKPAPPLPKEMLTLPKDDPNRSARTQLVAGLNQGAATPPPEDASANPFANTAFVNTPANSPIVAGTPILETAPAPEDEPEPLTESNEPEMEVTMQEDSPQAAAAAVLPEPEVDEVEPAAAPAPRPAPRSPAPPLKPMTPSNQFVCMACSAPHKFRSQLLKHAEAKHPERVKAIMAPYPAATQ